MKRREDLRNIAIVAHVDHGKTTLVDTLFQQGGVFHERHEMVDRVMDSFDQERERGITILAKATSVHFRGIKLQIVDTPGHADFGGEVERTLNMVDGILLLVDAAEGPLPQTRFVLRKALAQNLPVVLAINKIDRVDARPMEVVDEVLELLIDLGADDALLELPVLFTNGRAGTATLDLDQPGTDLVPLVDTLIRHIPAPIDLSDEPFRLQINSLGFDNFIGRLVIGRIAAGSVKQQQRVMISSRGKQTFSRLTGVFESFGVSRQPLEEARSGDIVVLSGFTDVAIGDTLCAPEHPFEFPPITVDEPTVAMVFQVNNGPLAGKSGGKFVTSRQIKERLQKEAYANVSIQVLDGVSSEQFRVLGRGELQLSVLLETLRREGFEMCVRNPEVVTRETPTGKEEPLEKLIIDLPSEHIGNVTQLLGNRKAQLEDQKQEGNRARLEFLIPTRGLFGLRGQMLTATRGTAMMSHNFEKWVQWMGPIPQRATGALVSDREGPATAYSLFKIQPRGILFIPEGTTIYEGMIIGEHNRDSDLNVNVVRGKKLTNVRASGKDEAVVLVPAKELTLEEAIEWIRDDEMIEVTPNAIRLRKIVLSGSHRSVKHPDL